MSRTRPRSLLRIAGWLLTPFVAWAASFFGGWLGLTLPTFGGSDEARIVGMVGGALFGGAAGIIVWFMLVSRVGHGSGQQGRD